MTKYTLYLAGLLILGIALAGCGVTSAPSAATISSPVDLIGVWQVQSINGNPVTETSPARIEFLDDGRIVGNASCNRFFGQYQMQSAELIIEDALGATRMMCLPELMEQEQTLLALLPGSHRVTLNNQTLMLMRDKRELIRGVKVKQ